MGQELKVLGQVAPAATTQTTLYTVPASTKVTVSTLHVCNQNNANVNVRVRIKVNGAADDPKQFLLYNFPIDKNDVAAFTEGFTLNAGDVVAVYSDTANVSFQLFGVEVTP